MRILALEPFYGGSHQAFLDGWRDHSRHAFTVLGLPAYKWKWRMRHAAVTFIEELTKTQSGASWDLLWCSDMLNLAEFLGMAASGFPEIWRLPRVMYFHENQLTYPVREEKERDLHFAYSNFTSALIADQVWFNSGFHRDEFLDSLRGYLKRMPDYRALDSVDQIAGKSIVQYPGIGCVGSRDLTGPGQRGSSAPLQIGWASRWEHDKNPEDFFRALRILKSRGVRFQITVLGQAFRNSPPIFVTAKEEFQNEVKHWGFLESSDAYHRSLAECDVFVSTANHEFFGIGVVEAIRCGARPLLPNRLAYPEVLGRMGLRPDEHLYDGSVQDLAKKLTELASTDTPKLRMAAVTDQFDWPVRAAEMDLAVERLMTLSSKTR